MKNSPAVDQINMLINLLNHQQVIAYPTEAVFGIGCDPDDETAVHRLLALKQRSVDKGLILIAADYQQLKPYIDDTMLTEAQCATISRCWPGPVTFVFPARPETSHWLTGRFTTLAVRVSDHPDVIALCKAYGKPLISTSANLNGQPPCRTWQEVEAQFGATFPILRSATGGRRNPSEIRDAVSGKLFRQG